MHKPKLENKAGGPAPSTKVAKPVVKTKATK